MEQRETIAAPLHELTDERVGAACVGATDEINALLTQMTPRLRLMVMARLGAAPPASGGVDEIVQTILIALARGLPRLRIRTVAGLMAFASRITSRKVAAAIRHRGGPGADGANASLDADVRSGSSFGPLGQFVATTDTTPFTAAARADQQRRVLAEIAELRPEHRQVVTLLVIDGVSTAEAARRLGITREAAAMRYHRAVQALRERLT